MFRLTGQQKQAKSSQAAISLDGGCRALPLGRGAAAGRGARQGQGASTWLRYGFQARKACADLCALDMLVHLPSAAFLEHEHL